METRKNITKIQKFEFSTMEKAMWWKNHSAGINMIVLGDNGRFWVADARSASRLVRMGYELA